MKAVALEGRPLREWALLAVGAALSLLVHCAGAMGAASIPPPDRSRPVWVEMAVVEPEPVQPDPVQPEPVQPEPEPEPQPKPKPEEVVEYTPEPAEPEPKPVPQDAKPVPRPVQGLSADSFANDGTSGLQARHGNTTAAAATTEPLKPGEEPGEFAVIPYTAVTKPPKIRYKPTLPIPQEVIDEQIEGRVEITLTVDGEGQVSEVTLVQGLHPAADAACLSSMRSSRWKPGTRDDVPVTTKNVPYSCRFQMAVD